MGNKPYEISLVRSAQSGDSASFAELYNLYYQKVFAFIRTIVRNSADAEDILQLTFLNAWRNLDQLSDPAAFNTWIQVIARNLSTSHLRKKNFVLLLDAEKDDAPADIEDIMTKSRSVMPRRTATPREPIKSATGRWWIGAIWWFSMWSTIQAELIRQCSMHKKKENGSSISPSDKMMNKKSSIACGKCCFGESA